MSSLDTTVCIGLECMGISSDAPSVREVVERAGSAIVRHPDLATEVVGAACVLILRFASSIDEARSSIERIVSHVGARS